MSQRFLTLGFLSLCLTLTACSSSDDPIDDDLGDGGIAGTDGGDGGDGGSGGMAGGSGGSGGGDGGSGGSAGDMSPDAGSSPDAGGEPDDDLDAGVDPDAGPGDEDDSLATGMFIKTLGSSNLNHPGILNTSAGRRFMFLLRAEDVAGSGNITALRLQMNAALGEAVTCPNTTIRMGHTTVTTLVDTFADNVEQGAGSFVTVVDDASIEIPAGDSLGFFEIPFETPVYYNGVDSLIFEIARIAGCSAGVGLRIQGAAGYFAILGSSDGATAEIGDLATSRLTAAFVFDGGDNKVLAAGGTGSVSGTGAPASNGRGQFLLLASDIDGSGPITGIGFELSEPAPETITLTYDVVLSHVDSETTELSETFADNRGGDATFVADELPLTIPAGASDFWLPLTESFDYDGTSNLLVEIRAYNVSGGPMQIHRRETTDVRVVTGGPGSATGTLYQRAAEPKLRFHGGTIDRVLGHDTEQEYMFPIDENGRSVQHLYLASELGTAGTITKLACRLRTATSTATDYPNFEVVMAHSEATALATNLESNLAEPEIVFSGTFSLPAGLIGGDWVEIPLTTEFEYDGHQNLLIQTRTHGGAHLHACAVSHDADLFRNRILFADTRNGTLGALMDYQSDLRLWIEK